jgi:hypothetical protein
LKNTTLSELMGISLHESPAWGFNPLRFRQPSVAFIRATSIAIPLKAICSPAHIDDASQADSAAMWETEQKAQVNDGDNKNILKPAT